MTCSVAVATNTLNPGCRTKLELELQLLHSAVVSQTILSLIRRDRDANKVVALDTGWYKLVAVSR
jgi:hypothetical protein